MSLRPLLLGLLAASCLAGSAAIAAPAYSVVQKVAGPDGGWDYASFDPVLRRVYVSRGDGVMVIDADSGAATAHFADGARVHSVVPIPGSDEILTTNGNDNSARILSAKDGSLRASVPTGKGPDAAVFDPATRKVFVMDHAGGDITIVDVAARKASGSIPVGGDLEFAAVDGKGRLYVNVEDKGEIAVVDTLGGKLVTRYALKDCVEPSGLVFTTGGMLIAACANGVAKVLDAGSGAEVATLKIGARPDAVIYDPGRRLAFVPAGGDGTLTVLSIDGPRKVSVAGSVATERGARTGTTDPKSGRIYLPTAQYTPPSAPGQRPGIVPGSFKVLVLAPG